MCWELSSRSKSKWRQWSSSLADELTVSQILCRQVNGSIGVCFRCGHVDLQRSDMASYPKPNFDWETQALGLGGLPRCCILLDPL
jgi:hypothetical protein